MQLDRYLTIALFGGYVAKVSIMGASLSDAAIILVLAAAHFLYNSQIQSKEVSELKQQVTSLMKDVQDLKTNVDDAKTALAGVKIAAGMRAIK